MITAKYIRENLELFQKSSEKRQQKINFDHFINLEKKRLTWIKSSEEKKSEINRLSKEVGQRKRKNENTESLLKDLQKLSQNYKEDQQKLSKILKEIGDFIDLLPNILDKDVPIGKSENENVEIKKVGKIPNFSFHPKAHFDLANEDYLNFSKTAKISGARFVIMRKEMAQLERALINFFIEENKKKGYEEISVPTIVNEKSIYGTGQLPKFKKDLFVLDGDHNNFYLIPTAEVPLTNIYSNEEIPENLMPFHFSAFSNCYRAEAGAAGRDTKGLMRLHEFKKVELVKITLAEESEQEHINMLKDVEGLLEKLEIPYRIMLLCGGDTGFSAAKCFDFEAWIPSEKKYREISSCSNCRDFQARRANIRIRRKNGILDFAHTLNGSALALGRTMIALLENHQQSDGSIRIPQALVKYFNKDSIVF